LREAVGDNSAENAANALARQIEAYRAARGQIAISQEAAGNQRREREGAA